MTDWYSEAREADGRTDEQIIVALRPCPGCDHPRPDDHIERDGWYWCKADMDAVSASGGDPRSVGPCY